MYGLGRLAYVVTHEDPQYEIDDERGQRWYDDQHDRDKYAAVDDVQDFFLEIGRTYAPVAAISKRSSL